MKAILIIDHGSTRESANRMLECMGALVQRMAGAEVLVRIAHMELAEPSIAQGFAACVAGGATEVVVFPYMLSPGKHSTRDIPRLVAEVAAAHPRVHYRVTPAFGVHEKLAAVVLERAAAGAEEPAVPGCCTRPVEAPSGYCGPACPAGTTEPAAGLATPAAGPV